MIFIIVDFKSEMKTMNDKISTKTFIEEIKNMFRGKKFNPQTIWQRLQGQQSQQNVAYYCFQIFDHLVASDKKETIIENQQKLLSTLLVLQVYKNRKIKKPNLLEDIKKLTEKLEVTGPQKWVLSVFRRTDRGEDFICELISELTYSPYVINFKQDPAQEIISNIEDIHLICSRIKQEKFYTVLKNICFPQSNTKEPLALTYIYFCLLNYIRASQNHLSREIFQHIKNVFKAYIHSLKSSRITEKYLWCLVHLVQNIFTFYGCAYPEIIKQMIFYCNNLRNAPGINGELGQDLFVMLHNQLKTPGYAFRKRLRADFPFLDISKGQKLNKEFFLVTSKQDFLSHRDYCTLMNFRKLIILHIFKVVGLKESQITSTLGSIHRMGAVNTYKIYYKVMKILDISFTLQVYQTISLVQQDAIRKLLSVIEKQEEVQDLSEKATQLQKDQFEALFRAEHPYNIFQYPSYEITHVPLSDFINPESKWNFSKIVTQNKQKSATLNFYKTKIPIVFLGSSSDFNKTLATLCEYLENANIQDSKSIKVFYLPSSDLADECEIGNYIAKKDLWYQRFVYGTFRERMLFPHLELDESNKQLFPSYFLGNILQVYLREARRNFPVRIYKCYCYPVDPNTKMQCIYMSLYAIFGSSAEAHSYKLTKQQTKTKQERYANIDYIELLIEKLRRVRLLNIDITMNTYDQINQKHTVIKEKNLKIEDLQVVNFPREFFMGKIPDPTSPYLEMSMLLDNYGKIFRRQVAEKLNFRKKGDQEIMQAFKDLFITHSVKQIEIEAVKIPFKAIIDGKIAEDLKKIRIVPAISQSGMHISIPLQTFLPFQTP